MADIPKTCKVAVLIEYGNPLEIREISIPEVAPRAFLSRLKWQVFAAPTHTIAR